MSTIKTTIPDQDVPHPRDTEVKIELGPLGIEIGAEGYGSAQMQDGYGYPVYLEKYQGHLRLVVWADINSEEPTHTIDLEGARESIRTTLRCEVCDHTEDEVGPLSMNDKHEFVCDDCISDDL